MLKEAIYKLIRKEDLLEEEMFAAMNQIMAGEATPALIGSFLTALRIKGKPSTRSPALPGPWAKCPQASRNNSGFD